MRNAKFMILKDSVQNVSKLTIYIKTRAMFLSVN